jgi:hypothetical protein
MATAALDAGVERSPSSGDRTSPGSRTRGGGPSVWKPSVAARASAEPRAPMERPTGGCNETVSCPNLSSPPDRRDIDRLDTDRRSLRPGLPRTGPAPADQSPGSVWRGAACRFGSESGRAAPVAGRAAGPQHPRSSPPAPRGSPLASAGLGTGRRAERRGSRRAASAAGCFPRFACAALVDGEIYIAGTPLDQDRPNGAGGAVTRLARDEGRGG